MEARNYSPLDQLIIKFDRLLTAVSPDNLSGSELRPSPAAKASEVPLNETDRRHSIGLMRVNHSGEVSAQALYQGQAITSRDDRVKQTMQESAREEIDHLAWCDQRVRELGGHTSLLNPFWYLGSFTIGTLAGLAGDKWSLGFLAETEHQVVIHLQKHLKILPEQDEKSRLIVEQMMEDEAKHGATAMAVGGVELPAFIKTLMKLSSRVMTRTAYWV